MGNAEARMQPYVRCVVVYPCATDGVLEPLARQQHVRSSPAFSLLTRRMCICKRWVRLMTARKPFHTDFTVTCFAQQQYHLAVSHLVVLHRYQPLVPPPSHLSHSTQVPAVGLTELGLGLGAKALERAMVFAPKI